MNIPTLTPRPLHLSGRLCGALLLGFFATPAHAQDESEVAACATAYEQAQVTRNDGKLKQSQEHLKICVRDLCPDFVKVDCGQWLSEIKREVPSVIFSAIDSKGAELPNVKVTIDGEVVAESLDGLAVDLDPGPHNITFEFDGRSQTKQLIVRQGEKNRVFRAEFVTTTDSDGDGVADDADLCPDTPGALGEDGCPAKMRPAGPASVDMNDAGSPIPAYALWGVGAAGFAAFGVFGLLGKSAEDDATKECINAQGDGVCSEERERELVDKVEGNLLVANIGLGVGATGAVVGTALFFLTRSPGSSSAIAKSSGDTALRFDAGPTPRGGFFRVSGSF